MSKPSPASTILARAARAVLEPIGLQQRGRSRLWFDDHDWWLVVVEFQPSGWSSGSYLNVAAMWLWKDTDHFSFDTEGSRLHSHVEFHDKTEFTAAAQHLAQLATARVLELRAQFAALDAVAAYLRKTPLEHGGWPEYHAGVAAALTGDRERARSAFETIARASPAHDSAWQKDLRGLAAELRERCINTDAFRNWASDVVADSRRKLRLEPLASMAFPTSGPQ